MASDPNFKKQCKLKTLEFIYRHQQNEHIKLMQALESVPQRFHKLPFQKLIHMNTPICALKEKAHEMLWHQRLIHLAPHAIRDAHKFVDGIPDLSKFSFDDLHNCPTCIKANLSKNSAGKRSLMESVTVPYQVLFVDFLIFWKGFT